MDELQKALEKARLAEARAAVFEQELLLTRYRLADGLAHEEVAEQLEHLPPEAVGQRVGELLDHNLKLSGYNAYLQSRVRSLEARLAETQQKLQADPLTGLAGPSQLHLLLQQWLEAWRRGKGSLALVLVELERPLLERTLSFERADFLTRVAGQRLADLLGPGDVLGRWGDSQFLILLAHESAGSEGQAALTQQAQALAQQATTVLAQPLDLLEGSKVALTAWAGVLVVSGGTNLGEGSSRGGDSGLVLDMVRRALKQARHSGVCPFLVYGGDLQARARRFASLEPALAQAEARQEFQVHYQPVVSASRGVMTGVEARLRWSHPSQGLLEARQFLDVLEESGLILATDEWVVSQACAQMAEHPELFVSINLSLGHLLAADVGRRLLALIEASKISPQRVCIDLPQQGLEMAPERLARLARELSRARVAVAIDGFGTRLSSLGGLPVRLVKLDSTLVANLGQPETQRLCRAALTFAHQLEVKVVAKGIESVQQATWLRQAGCDFLEGYFFSAPLPAERLSEVAAKNWLVGGTAAVHE